jgi:hypothetical protein
MSMEELERHTSPDGLLTLLVLRADDGDLTIGFEGYPSHTHGDILAELGGGTPETATRLFVDAVLSSEAVIVISRVGDEVRDVGVADDPYADDMKYALPNETIEKRYWNGQRFEP